MSERMPEMQPESFQRESHSQSSHHEKLGEPNPGFGHFRHHLRAGSISVAFDLWRAVGVGYASAYGRYPHDAHPCGYRYSAMNPDTSLRAAILEMTSKRFGCTGVVDAEGRLLGIVTDGDLRRHIENIDRPVADLMTRNPVTIRPQALAAEAVAILNGKAITSLFVLENQKPVGLIHIHDCLRAGVH